MKYFLTIFLLVFTGVNVGAAIVKFSPCRGSERGEIIREFCPTGFKMTSQSKQCSPGMMCAAVMENWCVGEAKAGRAPRCVSEDKKLQVMDECPFGYKLNADHCVEEKIK